MEGIGYDANNVPLVKISGSWLSHIDVTDLVTGVKETIWEEQPLIPDAHLQYFFNKMSLIVN